MGSVGWADAVLEPHAGRKERRQCSYRTSEGTRDMMVARMSLEVRCDEKLVYGGFDFFFEAPQTVWALLRTFGGRAAAAPVVVPLAMAASRL